MKILLTGATGFIGKTLYEGMKDAYPVFAPTHTELDMQDEVAVRKYIRANHITTVIHTAVHPGDGVLENILRMFMAIYKNMDLLDRFINFGSGAEYGKTRDLHKVKETEIGKHIPKDNYGLGKLICTQLSQDNKKVVHIRPFGIYGEYEDYRIKFITNSIVKNILHMPIIIKQDVLFDYLYVSDLIPIMKYILKNARIHGHFNVTPTRSIYLTELAKTINEISEFKSKIIVKHRNLNFAYTGSNALLRNTYPGMKITSCRDGIKKLHAYYMRNIDLLDKHAIIKDNYFLNARIRQ